MVLVEPVLPMPGCSALSVGGVLSVTAGHETHASQAWSLATVVCRLRMALTPASRWEQLAKGGQGWPLRCGGDEPA